MSLKSFKRKLCKADEDEELLGKILFKDTYVTPEYFQLKLFSGVNLNDKIEEYIDWYCEAYSNSKKSTIRNFIDKMAIWYELRYPSYEVNRLLPFTNQETTDINNIMFKENQYLSDKDIDMSCFEWDRFYNYGVFFQSLPIQEKHLLLEPIIKGKIYLDSNKEVFIKLDSDGVVIETNGIYSFTNNLIDGYEIIGLTLKEVIDLMKQKGMILEKDNELEITLEKFEEWIYQKEEILNCVMYRIIELGGKYVGPRRAYLFAKEFDRNLSIPIMFGMDITDSYLNKFIEEYLKDGGLEELNCFVGYFDRVNKKDKLKILPLKEIYSMCNEQDSYNIDGYKIKQLKR